MVLGVTRQSKWEGACPPAPECVWNGRTAAPNVTARGKARHALGDDNPHDRHSPVNQNRTEQNIPLYHIERMLLLLVFRPPLAHEVRTDDEVKAATSPDGS